MCINRLTITLGIKHTHTGSRKQKILTHIAIVSIIQIIDLQTLIAFIIIFYFAIVG